jgi:hypothetical protein
MSRTVLWMFVACIFAAEPTGVSAQTTYDNNALRLDSKFGDVRIVRGVDGPVVGRIGVFRGSDVAKIVETSAKAVSEAREFQRNYRPGTIILGLGLISLGVTTGVSQIHDVNRGITTGLTLATFGLITYGGGRLERAYNALSRSIWWYNRDLKG